MHKPGPKSGHLQGRNMETSNTQPHDEVADIMRYEAGEMDEAEMVEFFQRLVDSGDAWRLQGAYGRMAYRLIHLGLVNPKA
jgi:hypothetical protein